MTTMAEMAALENASMHRNARAGGSERLRVIPVVLSKDKTEPARSAPRPARQVAWVEAKRDAKEHISYCLLRGMDPQDVADSVSSEEFEYFASTWEDAIELIEGLALSMLDGRT